ncbi:MAG TPA: hypothetical protein PLZ36_01665 [Armatimonadota bacterium]|nr:hypothetical protein [Armatimonadota bacterium]
MPNRFRAMIATPLILSLCLFFGVALGANAAPAASYAGPPPLQPVNGKIGIFDLKAIHDVPLDAEVISKREEDGVVIEEITYTGRPGVRVYMVMTYKKGLRKRPVAIGALNVGTSTPIAEAKNTFVGVSVCPPCGNMDPQKKMTVGGPPFNQFFTDDPEQSWFYHYVVALTRALDYLETRPEADMSKITMSGFSTAGYAVNLLHAIENRPACYITYHSAGYYTNPDGLSGGTPGYLTRKQYEMYGPAAYAQYGSSPMFICSALGDYFSMFDALMELYANLRCPKRLAVSPNRGHLETGRNEFRHIWLWQGMWVFGGKPLAKVTDGTVTAVNGELIYTFTTDYPGQPQYADVIYSYGTPGNWAGRVWHRRAARKVGPGRYAFSIPMYAADVPLYILAQIETADAGVVANTPMYLEPAAFGITRPTAVYPKMLLDFEDNDDLYIPVGNARFVAGGATGNAAAQITAFADGTVHLMNIEPLFWTAPKTLTLYLKGDGRPGAVTACLSADRDDWKYPPITLVPEDGIFPATWTQYTIPLDGMKDLKAMSTLVIKLTGHQSVLIDGVQWQ